MAFQLTNAYRMFKDDPPGTLTPVGHSQDNSFEMSADEIDVSTKDTPFGQSETIPGTLSASASVTGLAFQGDTIGAREIGLALKNRETWAVNFSNTGGTPTEAVVVTGNFVWLTWGVNSNGAQGVVDFTGGGNFTGDVVIA